MSVKESLKLKENGFFGNDDLESNNTSILEFLNDSGSTVISENELFQEINRLSDNKDDRSLEEIIKEAETLIKKQPLFNKPNKTPLEKNNQLFPNNFTLSCESTPLEMRTGEFLDQIDLDENHLEIIVEQVSAINLSFYSIFTYLLSHYINHFEHFFSTRPNII